MISKKIVSIAASTLLALSATLSPVMASNHGHEAEAINEAGVGYNWTSNTNTANDFSVNMPFTSVPINYQTTMPGSTTNLVTFSGMASFSEASPESSFVLISTTPVVTWASAQALVTTLNTQANASASAMQVLRDMFGTIEGIPELRQRTGNGVDVIDFNITVAGNGYAMGRIMTSGTKLYLAFHMFATDGIEAPVFDEFISSFVAR